MQGQLKVQHNLIRVYKDHAKPQVGNELHRHLMEAKGPLTVV